MIAFRSFLRGRILCLVAGLLSLAVGTSASARSGHADVATLRIQSDSFLPGWSLECCNLVVTAINAGLVRELPDGRVAPDLATWTLSQNHRLYTFTIRHDARFSNGHYVTAQDAAFSLRRLLAPAADSLAAVPGSGAPPPITYLGLIQGAAQFHAGASKVIPGVKVLNAHTLQIAITRPAAYFLGALTVYSAVLDPAVVSGKPVGGNDDYLTTTCIGNQGAGPFMLVCHDRSSTVRSFYSGGQPMLTLTPNPYYYGPKPHIKIEALGSAAPTRAYVEGKIDSLTDIQFLLRNGLSTKSEDLVTFPSALMDFLTPNLRLAPFDNVHCRLAVAYAIDREALDKLVERGTAHPAYDMVPRGMLGWYAGDDNPHYNPTRARAEFARCPQRTTPVQLVYTVGPVLPGESFIVDGLARVGFNVKLLQVSTPGPNSTGPLFQLALAQWAQTYPDPQGYCTLSLRSGQPFNLGGWHNAAYDRLVDKADTTLDSKERAKLYIRAQHIALSQGALIAVDNRNSYALTKPYVHGLVGTEAFPWLVPKDGDWSNVSVDPH